MKYVRIALDWLKPRLWIGRESGSDFYGWYNAVYLRVGSFVLHLGINRDTA